MKLLARIQLEKLLSSEEFDQWRNAQQSIKAAKVMVLRAFNTSAEGSVINKTGHDPVVVIENGYLNVTYKPLHLGVQLEVTEITEWDLRDKPAKIIPESVLNTLLHGKLLNDEQKKLLLIEQGYIKAEAEK